MDLPGGLNLQDIIPIIAIGVAQASRDEKTPRRTGQSRREYLNELLSSNSKRIYEVLRIKRETFCSLCQWFKSNTNL